MLTLGLLVSSPWHTVPASRPPSLARGRAVPALLDFASPPRSFSASLYRRRGTLRRRVGLRHSRGAAPFRPCSASPRPPRSFSASLYRRRGTLRRRVGLRHSRRAAPFRPSSASPPPRPH